MSAYGSLVVGWRLEGRHVLVIGGNQVTANRIEFALDARPTSVTLIYPRSQISCQRILELIVDKAITYHDKKFNKSDLASKRFDLVLTAIDDADLSKEIALVARDNRIPINVAEIPALCDFLFMPTFRNGHLQIAISTAISSTTQHIAHKLRQHVIESLPDDKEVVAAVNNVATIKDALGATYAVALSKITSSLQLTKLAKLSEDDIRRLISEYIVSGVSDEDEADKASNSSNDEKKSDVTVIDEHVDNQITLKSRINDILFNPNGSLLANGGVHFIDGKTSTAYIAYAMSDTLFVYPTTRTNYNGQVAEDWSSKSLPNAFGRQSQVVRMETRSGAALAITGAASTSTDGGISALVTSQSIVEMIPNLYALVYERAPFVLHVAAYAYDDDMNVIVDYSDVLLACETGAAILFSFSAQETQDMALISHLAATVSKTPFIHVFDGVRMAHRFTKTQLISHKDITKLLNDVGKKVSSTANNNDPTSAVKTIETVIGVVGKATGKTYKLFEYYGTDDAEVVMIVSGGENDIIRGVMSRFKASGDKVGAVLVRVYRPWSEKHFFDVLPTTTRCIIVLEQAFNIDEKLSSSLFTDVVSSVRSTKWKGTQPSIVNTRYSPSVSFTQQTVRHILAQYKSGEKISIENISELSAPDTTPSKSQSDTKHCIFWDTESADTVEVANHLSSILSTSAQLNVQSYSSYDIYNNGGVVESHLYFGSSKVLDDSTKADYITIHDTSLISKYDILGAAKARSIVLLNANWSVDELDTKLANDFKLRAAQKEIQLYVIDAGKIVQELSLHPNAINIVLQSALLSLYKHELLNSNIKHVITSLYEGNNEKEVTRIIQSVIDSTKASLTRVDILPTWLILEESGQALPSTVVKNSFGHNLDQPETPKAQSYTWHTAAKLLLFKEAHNTTQELRPDLPEKTFTVKVRENRRLTPANYERYLFHIEFDTTGTDLKYDLGEALGVYGHNDTDEVNQFLAFYGLDPDRVVSIPDKDGTHYESRTTFQIFSQILDIFGRPSKKFYEALAQFAIDVNERKQLLWIASTEGTAEFKRRVEDTVTYADLLYEFTSAKPPLEDLVQIVAPIKPRHYSIASSQSVHPSEVHLLVVTVDWKTATGKKRYGQCTRYLAGLKVGESVTVSIKPSVMKLPPRDEQPVIMAGLGTGMAPFRAFIEERAYRKSKGINVGPMILYFGSRHRSMEYLYGEELEAYHREGLLTYLRLAFSRDQAHKIYIQHKMQEDAELLHDFLMKDEGWFYLCGPTWPVPDVRDAIVNSFVSSGGMTDSEAADWVNKLKDLERYILEVY
ncbi:8760_t:CDS:1 [Paraglomus occultum]|uniref:8760_t:CDS:1 n=1 Tax=Paraglomus occultum TaxID=144539 RepID=A0A9N8VU61_9GLOM|nr:8760_t:CDS:1 [Paraglomus occultum]